MNMITNPILTGFNPDPSICRVGDDFYIATSTFDWFPGVQIHHSRDLVHWHLLTRPLTRVSQLNMKGNPDSCGVWAPNLTYKDGMFYLVYTDVKRFDGRWKDTHNYLVTATEIDGEWSDPIYLNSSGFDPSLFHDEDGRAWVPNLLVDHRKGKFFGGIVLQEYSYREHRLIGEVYYIFPGTALGVTEGPVLFKCNGWYYLITAEGNEPQVQIEAPDLPVCRWEALPERCDFEDETMPIDFQSLRVPMDETWVSLRKRSGFLSIKGRESLCSTHHQSMIARRQQDFNFTATTRLEFQPDTFQQMAGLAYYYNTRHFYYLFMSWEESLNSYVLNIFVNDDNRWSEPLPEYIRLEKGEVWLRATVQREKLNFSYSIDGDTWQEIGGTLDASIISDDYVCNKFEYKAAFTGAFIGICCQDVSGRGKWAYFDSFEYKPLL